MNLIAFQNVIHSSKSTGQSRAILMVMAWMSDKYRLARLPADEIARLSGLPVTAIPRGLRRLQYLGEIEKARKVKNSAPIYKITLKRNTKDKGNL